MAYIEGGGYRPVQKEAAFDAGVPGGMRKPEEKQSEIHTKGIPTVQTYVNTDGKLKDVPHLHIDQRGGKTRWWVERESIFSWQERVRKARENDLSWARDISEDRIPSSVSHYHNDGYSEQTTPYYTFNSGDQTIFEQHPPVLDRRADAQSNPEQEQNPKKPDMGSAAYYISLMQDRTRNHKDSHLTSGGKVEASYLGGQARRAMKDAESAPLLEGTEEAKETMEDPYWAYQAVAISVSFQERPKDEHKESVSERDKYVRVREYNSQQRQWAAIHGDALKGVELSDPQAIRALSWMLDKAGIEHEAFDSEPVRVSFAAMEEEMRRFSYAYSLKHGARWDHEAATPVFELMREWKKGNRASF